MVGLLGPSGSGKSTALRMVSGLLRADAGRVAVHGRTVQDAGRLSREVRELRRGIGVIFQQFNLVGRLSLLTNVLAGRLGHMPYHRANLGLFTRQEKLIALEALERVGMLEYAHQRASTLSGGQQQRAAIARALTQQARVILADEPIASLDPAAADRVMQTLRRINREDGATVVVSLHQVDYALQYCDRIIALKDGRLRHDGPAAEADEAFFIELYGQALHAPADEAAGAQPALSPAAE
jgi:phosphonate transport system ATP-binding protein